MSAFSVRRTVVNREKGLQLLRGLEPKIINKTYLVKRESYLGKGESYLVKGEAYLVKGEAYLVKREAYIGEILNPKL